MAALGPSHLCLLAAVEILAPRRHGQGWKGQGGSLGLQGTPELLICSYVKIPHGLRAKMEALEGMWPFIQQLRPTTIHRRDRSPVIESHL